MTHSIIGSGKVADRLGFAPIELGRLDHGGVPLHAIEGKHE